MNNRFADNLNFLSKLTPARAFNMLSVVSSYYISRWGKKPVHWGMPVSLAFEPTTSCNLRCPECPSGLRSFTRPTGMLEDELFKTVIDELSGTLSWLIFYFQGEPYLNPRFLELVKYASGKGIYTATSTNAHYLNGENAKNTIASGLDRLIISIDGTTQDTYQQYRIGGSLDKVIEGTRNLIRWKKELKSKTPHTIFQFLVVKPNEHQVSEVKKLAASLGVDEVRFKTAQVYDYEHGNPLIPDADRYSRYSRQEDGTYRIKNNLENHCWKLWHSCVVTWDGRVVPCCFDKDASHQLGELKRQSFQEVWKSQAYQSFRASVLRSRSEIDICKNCTEGTKVWA